MHGQYSTEIALAKLLSRTGLKPQADISGAFALVPTKASVEAHDRPADESAESLKPQPRTTDLESVWVTSQKRTERVQDVPMAITVLGGADLAALKIEGGAELLRAVPNATFSKTNFSTHNFQIRGIGTQALPFGAESGVAINLNGMPLARNRFYEQEYFDVDRIEILRGPQGTLRSRNATAGVVDLIPNLPGDAFEARLSAETGSYSLRRLSGTINQPITDELGLRLAGVFSERDGTDYNTVTRRRINDRSQWGGRLSVAWTPDPTLYANAVWERFREDDRRARSGKQLCHPDPGPARIGEWTGVHSSGYASSVLNQSCRAGSLYSTDAFGVPNPQSMPLLQSSQNYIFTVLGVRLRPGSTLYNNDWDLVSAIENTEAYAGVVQSSNLREIAAEYDPRFHAANDTAQANFRIDISDRLTLDLQSGWTRDRYWSSQDYNRFPSNPVFGSSNGLFNFKQWFFGEKVPAYPLIPDGKFNDPQLGPSSGVRSADLSRSYSSQWWQEVRLSSHRGDAFDYTFGANYLDFKIDEDYFVFNNIYTLYSLFNFGGGNSETPLNGFHCGQQGSGDEGAPCIYVDPTPMDRLDGNGHNYFRSRSLSRLKSAAVFAEGYWMIADGWKLNIGARYTDDWKTTTPVPSQLLLAPGRVSSGNVQYGYPTRPDIRQHWGAGTGRIALDWKPRLTSAGETMIYASISRGYKAGGANSAGPDFNPEYLDVIDRPQTFEPEYLTSFEVGTKNSLLSGRLQLNAAAFHYDYRDYQVSKYVDRSLFTENFDASVFGVEVDAVWQPTPRWRLDGHLGLLRTRIGKGERSIDVMNRTQGRPDWVVVQPWLQMLSNCVAPADVVDGLLRWSDAHPTTMSGAVFNGLCGTLRDLSRPSKIPPESGIVYDRMSYPDVGQNQGEGFAAALGGNELPGAPRIAYSLGAQYTHPLSAGWELTVRGDYYQQGDSWARVYNAVNDRLRGWGNANLAVVLAHSASGFKAQLYVKNLRNEVPITGAFINGDDSALTTNVFTLDPRIVGLIVSKDFP